MENRYILILFLFLIFLDAYASKDSDKMDKILCGAKPADKEEEKRREHEARSLERQMPPVRSQTPSEWCYAFVAADSINYHNYVNSGMKAEDFYQDSRMLSVIDAVGIHNRYLYPDPPVDKISTKEGGFTTGLWRGIQEENYSARSRLQVPFHSLDRANERVRNFIRDLADEYDSRDDGSIILAGERCPLRLYRQDSFQEKIRELQFINNFLYQMAVENNSLEDEFTVINYQSLAEKKGRKDIAISPYTINRYRGSDIDRYLSFLRDVLYPKNRPSRPISVPVCSETLISPHERPETDQPCEAPHGVNLVGAFYRDGVCMVRLRNTWGADWEDSGYINLPLATFLLSQMKYSKGSSNNLFKADWISNPTLPGIKDRDITDTDEFIGTIKEEIEDITRRNESVNILKRHDGYRYNKFGALTHIFNFDYGDGRTFTGKVIVDGDEWKPKSGAILNAAGDEIIGFDSLGKVERVYRQPLVNGNTYTGNVRDKGDGTWEAVKGQLYNQEGELIYVYNHEYRGRIYTGSAVGVGTNQWRPRFFSLIRGMIFEGGSKSLLIPVFNLEEKKFKIPQY